jgi:hypothetical protein
LKEIVHRQRISAVMDHLFQRIDPRGHEVIDSHRLSLDELPQDALLVRFDAHHGVQTTLRFHSVERLAEARFGVVVVVAQKQSAKFHAAHYSQLRRRSHERFGRPARVSC